MTTKPNRKALLRSSIQSESESVERRYAPTDVDKRYAAAEGALEGRPLGLVGPTIVTPQRLVDLRAEIGGTAAVRAVLKISLQMAHDNPMNARQIYDPETVKSLSASIATRGQLVPAPAVPHPHLPGHVLLIDGHYRKRALHAAGKTEIEVVMQDVAGDLDMYRLSFLINEERNAQSPLDNALAWAKLLTEGKIADSGGIAEMLGISPALVAKTMAFLKLPDAALARMRESPAKFGAAVGYGVYRCSKVMPETTLLALMERIVTEDLSSRAIDALGTKLEAGQPRKKKEVSRQYKILDNKKQIGVIKEWDSGKLAFEVRFADPKDRQRLLEELKQRFNLSDTA
jgi:ParB family chromosome partitioning protein